MAENKEKTVRIIATVLLGIFTAVVMWITVFSRSKGVYTSYQPFWSFKGMLEGDKYAAKMVIENILLFIPFGFLIQLAFWTKNVFPAVICGFILSLTIELVQFLCKLGSFEIDDIINNTFGTLIGCLMAEIIISLLLKNEDKA